MWIELWRGSLEISGRRGRPESLDQLRRLASGQPQRQVMRTCAAGGAHLSTARTLCACGGMSPQQFQLRKTCRGDIKVPALMCVFVGRGLFQGTQMHWFTRRIRQGNARLLVRLRGRRGFFLGQQQAALVCPQIEPLGARRCNRSCPGGRHGDRPGIRGFRGQLAFGSVKASSSSPRRQIQASLTHLKSLYGTSTS